jgi:hypothetical protein
MENKQLKYQSSWYEIWGSHANKNLDCDLVGYCYVPFPRIVAGDYEVGMTQLEQSLAMFWANSSQYFLVAGGVSKVLLKKKKLEKSSTQNRFIKHTKFSVTDYDKWGLFRKQPLFILGN